MFYHNVASPTHNFKVHLSSYFYLFSYSYNCTILNWFKKKKRWSWSDYFISLDNEEQHVKILFHIYSKWSLSSFLLFWTKEYYTFIIFNIFIFYSSEIFIIKKVSFIFVKIIFPIYFNNFNKITTIRVRVLICSS